MSFFEVKITPPRVKGKLMQSREPTIVTMAPFSQKSILTFEDVPISKTATRILRIINPSDDEIQVTVKKNIKPEHNVTLEWLQNTVPAHGAITMELKWTPKKDTVCQETLQFIDNRNFRKDVIVVFKTKPNDSVKNVRKFPTVSSSSTSSALHVQSLRLKSASNSANKGYNSHNRLSTVTAERLGEPIKKPFVANVKKNTTPKKYNMNCESHHLPTITITEMDEHKENVTPRDVTPFLNIIDNMQFTPTVPKIKSKNQLSDSLSLMPTPTAPKMGISYYTNISNLKPKCLTADLTDGAAENTTFNGDCMNDSKNLTSLVNNKTFDVKYSSGLEHPLIEEEGAGCDFRMLNKTTVIDATPLRRPLEIIKEEIRDCGTTFIASENEISIKERTLKQEPEMLHNEDLMRDINLVGKPLRKYSSSMKDLNQRSPNSNSVAQGSLPNLNEMESIRVFEQNRFFRKTTSTVINSQSHANVQSEIKEKSNILNCNDISLNCHPEVLFNHCEILAQSSRFNLNEVKNTPYVSKLSQLRAKQKRTTPQQPTKKTIEVSTAYKRRSDELSLAEAHNTSPPTTTSNRLHPNPTNCDNIFISPPKKQRLDINTTFLQRTVTPTNASSVMGARTKWSHVQPKKIKLVRTLSLVKKPITPRKIKEEPRIQLYDSDLYLQTCINPDPFAASTTCDPFLASTMYLDEAAVDKHQIDMKKWLNALVTIPADLETDSISKIDVGKLFNEVRNKGLVLAPTKETQSINYLTNCRLETLRRAAIELFMSEEVRVPCSQVAVHINKNALKIRNDRNLHLDVVTQREILELLLCFNPLWLRLGLEVVYGEKINLQSNRDIIGLSSFILTRFFRDKFLEQKYSKAFTLGEEYAHHIKKFTLQKFLFLLLFLDKAKDKRIIAHNPCLFVKKSPYKETREILLRFSAELLANVGDITRELRRLKYVLTHKQSYLDEFNYAFHNLAIDLRDGVRLTRVMEIILLRNDLTKQLRVPAISRLQRIFNVNVALKALAEADFQLKGGITANDIVDGHREKTLSLLWQIIYKFRSPKFHAAAQVLQKWWRKSWLKVVIRRRLLERETKKRERAAVIIQSAYRGFINRKYASIYRVERTQAVIILQKYVRRYLAQQHLLATYHAIVWIQRWFRAYKLSKACRQEFLKLRKNVVCIQRHWRKRQAARRIREQANEDKIKWIQTKHRAATVIQTCWRRHKAQKNFTCIVSAAVVIQRAFISFKRMKEQLLAYQQLKHSAIILQTHFRAQQAMKRQRSIYQNMRQAAICLQQRYRALTVMRQQRAIYLKFRQSIIYIQNKWRATLLMRKTRVEFLTLQYHVTVIQQIYRSKKQTQIIYKNYQELKATVVWMQKRYRDKLRIRQVRQIQQKKLQAILTIQQHFRAYKQMHYQRSKYLNTKTAISCLQRHVRSFLKMKSQRQQYLAMKAAAITIQTRYKANKQMKQQRTDFLQLRKAVIRLQQRFRANRQMRWQIDDYQRKRRLIVNMQKHFRAKQMGRKVRQEYLQQRQKIVRIQQVFRARQMMIQHRLHYQHIRNNIIKIQRYYRSYVIMKRERKDFLKKREAAVKIQTWYRSVLNMRKQRQMYLRQIDAILTIQRKWRATVKTSKQRKNFLNVRNKIIQIQRRVRATYQMRLQCQIFESQRKAALVLQRHFRAHRQMLKNREEFQRVRFLVIWVQQKFRAKLLMRTARNNFLLTRSAVIHLQQKFRSHRKMLEIRAWFLKLKTTIISFQAKARGFMARRRFQMLMSPELIELRRQTKAAKCIQRFWRGYRIRKRFCNAKLLLIRKNCVLLNKAACAANAISTKIKDSVNFLRGRYCAADALDVLKQLDRISRTVPHVLIDSSDFISTFCYGIMAQAIRSEIDKYLIMYCSRIILNLARYNSTNANVFQEGGLVTIAQMLLRWCDKDCEIFNILCTLIWVFAHCPIKRKIIHDFMTTTEAVYMVRETKKLVARKEKMKQNVRKPVIPTNTFQNRLKNQESFPSRALPSLEPDYGVIRTKPYAFISSVYAFETILCKLGIKII